MCQQGWRAVLGERTPGDDYSLPPADGEVRAITAPENDYAEIAPLDGRLGLVDGEARTVCQRTRAGPLPTNERRDESIGDDHGTTGQRLHRTDFQNVAVGDEIAVIVGASPLATQSPENRGQRYDSSHARRVCLQLRYPRSFATGPFSPADGASETGDGLSLWLVREAAAAITGPERNCAESAPDLAVGSAS